MFDYGNRMTIHIRPLIQADAPVISSAFASAGAVKPVSTYLRYLSEQAAGTRFGWIAMADDQFAGYVTLNRAPDYPGFAALQIPEIQDLNVLPQFRRNSIGSRLLDRAESEAAKFSAVIGIGVGLHPGYNAAQRLYVMRGYVPDGLGVTYRNRYVEEYAPVTLDDDLLLHLTKRLHEIPS